MITKLPKGAAHGVVLLHGRGGSAADLLNILDHADLPQIAAVAPEAPGRSWWPSSFLAPMAEISPHLTRGLSTVTMSVNALVQKGILRENIWLLGFSQGACLALEAFARTGEGLAGVLGFSGGLVGTDDTGVPSPALYGHADKRFAYSPLSGTAGGVPVSGGQVWISAHESDPHIPLKRVTDSADVLTRAGAQVQTQIYPGAGHAIMRADIAALRARLSP